MEQIRHLVADEFAAVDRMIIAHLRSRVALAEDIGQYLIDAGGKRMRPLLSLLAAGACGPVSERQISLAVVIEFIHTATLLHDDVVDISTLRRGMPTANARWGNAPSVLVGDFIYSRAFQIMLALDSPGLLKLLADTTNVIAEGELLQLSRAGDPDCDEATYFNVIKDKTAVLFRAASAGAALLSPRPELESVLGSYGENLGLAFQLIDDVLDYCGNPEDTGKNIGDDLGEGKMTLPLIYAVANANQADGDLIRYAICNKTVENLAEIIRVVTTGGAIEYTINAAKSCAADAAATLDALPSSAFREQLHRLTEIAVARAG